MNENFIYPSNLDKLFTNDIPKIKQIQIYVAKDGESSSCHDYMIGRPNVFLVQDHPVWFLPEFVLKEYLFPSNVEKYWSEIAFLDWVDGVARVTTGFSEQRIFNLHRVIPVLNEKELVLHYPHQTQPAQINFSDEDLTTDEQKNIAQKIRDLQDKIHPHMVGSTFYMITGQIWTHIRRLNNLINQK